MKYIVVLFFNQNLGGSLCLIINLTLQNYMVLFYYHYLKGMGCGVKGHKVCGQLRATCLTQWISALERMIFQET